ncbi:hypothetical protein P7C70_g2306, partial [Phenoliferia sp. Uapishka_3]
MASSTSLRDHADDLAAEFEHFQRLAEQRSADPQASASLAVTLSVFSTSTHVDPALALAPRIPVVHPVDRTPASTDAFAPPPSSPALGESDAPSSSLLPGTTSDRGDSASDMSADVSDGSQGATGNENDQEDEAEDQENPGEEVDAEGESESDGERAPSPVFEIDG